MSAADTVAAGKLRAFVERIERLEEERKAIADDIAEVYAELKDAGFDKQAAKAVLKIRKADDGLTVWTERSLLVDAYLSALGMLSEKGLAPARAHARVENIEKFCPETGEIKESDGDAFSEVKGSARPENAAGVEPSPSDTDEPDDAADASGDYLREPATAASGQIIREGDAPRETGRLGGDASCPGTEFQSARSSSRAEQTGAVVKSPAAAPVDHFEPPAFLRQQKTMRDFRPHCLEPECCRSSTLDHCYACRKALETQAGSEAA